MRFTRSAVVGAITFTSAVLGIPAALVQLGVIEHIWPAGVVAALTIGLLLAAIYIVASRRATRVDLADQALLDDLLHVLCRKAMRLIAQQDFYATWPAISIHPIKVFVLEYEEVEHQFRDPELEASRAELYARAVSFIQVEAHEGYPDQYDRRRRNAGYTPTEAEGLPEREELIEQRHQAILTTAEGFDAAHRAFVLIAKRRGYNIDALSRDRHPRVQEWDQIYENKP
jgi:hypothetical protein